MPFVRTSTLTLHVQHSGVSTAPPLVFLNPVGSDLRVWDAVAADLAAGFQLIRYDLRGQGLSDAPDGDTTLDDHVADLANLLDVLGHDTVSLAGCSLGGLIAQGFALASPERVRRLALLDTLPRIGTEEGWTARMAQVRERGLEVLAPDLIRRWFAPAYFAAHPDDAHGYTTLLARSPQAGYLGSCAALRDADLTAHMDGLRPPTVVLCGESDVSTPPDACRAFAARIGAEFALVADAAHLPMVEQPQAVSRRLAAFLRPESSRLDQGLAVRRQVLGAAHVDRASAQATDLDRDFQQFITEYAWGGPWSRGHLDTRTRHLLTLAILTALPREHELELHVRATLNTGVTPDDLREVFMHVAVYAGVPVANRAFAIAKSVLREEP
ncbi:3-oxoadipate enol-lactonase/4-carboxymuconolactone decarboxylase [Deinococcus metalli]|uniref:3-oxoadipate enol-lactonase n=1 Tax=Deinococcus metalli TaxID=1141878 RepID=A0A7W8KF61_9DEIO|nr:3-oxoadipate enol-lactonase [Deinococcus metalli]MBB5376785.1 3-oxoadipate enol-lactonase/4-carboxymuconolactone decarboxylase [Deinococcus metalli]GHF45332.1 3-oxoadipate enol-lactonase [Deinococcus metalli]